jgi:hypothetical protein
VVNGWSSADIGGGYILAGTAADFDVNGTAGTINIPAKNIGRQATLDSLALLDVNITFRVRTNKLAAGDSENACFIARHVSSNTEYRGQVRFSTNKTVHLRAIRIVNGTWTAISPEVKVTGLQHAANGYIWVRAQVVGANPTTIRMKAWADGQAEPANWQYSATDSSAKLQSAGSVGLRGNLSPGVTNAPVVFTFDDFRVTAP